ncbi:hypothetical protein CY35_19G076800 [Sphagnum magellanicum]|nr:hypothetical protein CY35_19G076800 [Sphagnum magellanicum]
MECWSPQIEALICCKQIVNVREETKSLAFNVIAQFLLGSRLRSGPVNDALREDFYILCEGLLAIPIKLPGTKFSKALQARARIIETLERDVVSKPRPENDEDHYADYMENTRRENFSGMTEERLLEKTRSHMLGMMFAGHETAACAMLFAVKYISEHPDVLAELRAEHEKIQVAKYGSDSRLTWEDFKSMHFTQHVITETLRLSTPVALLWREAIEDVPLHARISFSLSLRRLNPFICCSKDASLFFLQIEAFDFAAVTIVSLPLLIEPFNLLCCNDGYLSNFVA